MTPYLLNLADLALTLHAIHHGGVELNPLLQSIPVMVAWKVVGVGVLCGVLEVLARDGDTPLSHLLRKCQLPLKGGAKYARWGLRLCTAVYAAVCVYHLFFIGGAF